MANIETSKFKQYTDLSTSFWDDYVRGRPKVPPSFWRRLSDFHTQHGNGQFSHVHDLGSGPGVHALALGNLFSEVTLTDPSTGSIEAAAARLEKESNYTCRVGRGEDPVDQHESEKYDMVFVGAALHWMEPEQTLRNIADSLKRGGTFVAAFFGTPDVVNQEAEEWLRNWFVQGIDMVLHQGTSGLFPYSIVSQDTGFDSIKMDSNTWGNVTRLKLNRLGVKSHGWVTDEIAKVYRGSYSEVTNDETIVEEEDKDWYLTTDLKGLRDVCATYPLPPNPAIEDKMWDAFEQIYGSGPVDIHFGVNAILATKK